MTLPTTSTSRPDDAEPALLETSGTGSESGPPRGLGLLLLVGGLVGAVAAVTLLLEKIALLTDPGYVPSCSIDPVLSCGSIMRTAQASAFGFPNPVIGVAAFPLVAAAGALVLGRVGLPRWFWLALQLGATAGVAFVHWLIVESLGVIGALCPYCMVVWAAVIPIFWFVTVTNVRAGHLDFGAAGRALVRRPGIVLGLWYAALVVAIVAAFPDYWASVVGF